MAILENKGKSPVVVALANFCCFGILGYILIGQSSKALLVFIATIVLSLVGVGIIISILAIIDGYQVAEAIEKGEEIDENEYKLEILYTIMKIVHKDAIYKEAAPTA